MAEDRFKAWVRPETKHGVMNKYLWVVFRPEHLDLGEKTDIGAFTAIFAHHGVEIGERVQIGSHCSIYSLSTINSVRDENGIPVPITAKVTIKKGAQIGSHCTIMPGVTVGENAIVGAHSFVKEDVPDGAFVGGVPAKIIKR